MNEQHTMVEEQSIRVAERPLEGGTDHPPLIRKAYLLGKYGSASIAATSADFAVFHIGLTFFGCTPVWATIIGRAMGSVVAFLLHRSWVFRHSKKRDGNALRMKYVLGIFIGMGLNAGGVWILNSLSGFDPWPARIAAASSVWFFGFLFNKTIVFADKGSFRRGGPI